MKKQNKQKGITLIALVITIIVLLILAGITINLTIGQDGIITKAQQAGKNYVDAANYENQMLKDFESMTDDILTNVTGGNGGGGSPVTPPAEVKVTGITLNKTSIEIAAGNTETLTATIAPSDATNKNLTWTSDNASVATVNDGVVTGVATGTATITVEAQDGSGKKATCNVNVNTLASKAQPGDYVEYDGGNGYTGLWRVLYNDATYGLQIISSGTAVEKYTLGGSTEAEVKASYNSAVDTLNSECAKYVNTSYATSGRCVGSNPLSPADAIADTDTVTLEWDSTDSGCKVADTNYETDYNAMQAANSQGDRIYAIGQLFWLASRYVDSDSSGASFKVNAVAPTGGKAPVPLWNVKSDGSSNPYSRSFYLRPVITLKSGIRTNSGDGSSGSPFKLVAM